MDTIPDTNFPDIRNKCAIHSNNGSCLVIPREGDKVRLYMQLTEADVVTNGRVDKSKVDPQKLLAVRPLFCICSLIFITVDSWFDRWQRSRYSLTVLIFQMRLIGGQFTSVRAYMVGNNSIYRFNNTVGQRVASSFHSKGRVFIAGDACKWFISVGHLYILNDQLTF